MLLWKILEQSPLKPLHSPVCYSNSQGLTMSMTTVLLIVDLEVPPENATLGNPGTESAQATPPSRMLL